MKPQAVYDLASAAFHDGEFHAYAVDSAPFADDLPDGIGIRLPKVGAVLECQKLPGEPIRIYPGCIPVARAYYLQSLFTCLVGP